MRVLVLTQYFWPETFRINEVVESLQRAGCEVIVLTGQPNYPEGKTFAGYRAFSTRREIHPASGCRVLRVPLAPRGPANAWRLAVNYLSFVASATLCGAWMLRGQRFDVIFVYGISPILQSVPGIFLRRSKGAALVTWVQDLWPQSLETTGFVKSPRLLGWVGSVVRWIYARNDMLLTQSRAFVPTCEAMADGTPVRYHPNPGELSFDQPMRGESRVALESGFNVVFAGNLGTVQALETVLDAAERLREHRDIHIVLVGSGSRGEWLMQEAGRRNLHNIRFAGRMPPEAMPAILEQASALLVTLARSPIMSQTIPSKIQAYLAAGRPVIASLDGEGARVIEEAGAGVACPAEDAGALAQAILQLRALSPQEREAMGQAGRCYYLDHFDPAWLAGQLVEHFRDAAASAGHRPLRATETGDR